MIKINEKDLKGIEERFKKLLKISNEPFLKEERLKFSLKNNSKTFKQKNRLIGIIYFY